MTVDLDFGPVFTGEARFLELAVRAGGALGNCGTGGGYTTLSPRTELTATPYALGLRVPFEVSGQNDGASVFSVTNTSSVSSSSGLLGIHIGRANFPFSDRAGVRGESVDSVGAGVLGISDNNAGVIGYSDRVAGVLGRSDGPGGAGVWGLATQADGIGVLGAGPSDGWAGYFNGRSYFHDRVGIGTLSPTAELDVNGTIQTNSIRMSPGAGSRKVLTSDAAGNGTWSTTPMGVVDVRFISGSINTPTSTIGFLSPVISVTVSQGQKIVVIAHGAFGSTSPGGAGGLDIAIGYRVAGTNGTPSFLGGGMFNLTCLQNQRTVFGISGVISGLSAQTYEVGMIGDDDGNGGWNSNEWAYVTIMVVNN